MVSKTTLLVLGAGALFLLSRKNSGVVLASGLKVDSNDLLSSEERANYAPSVAQGISEQRQQEQLSTVYGQPYVMGQFTAHPSGYVYSGFDMAWIRPDLYNSNATQQIWR